MTGRAPIQPSRKHFTAEGPLLGRLRLGEWLKCAHFARWSGFAIGVSPGLKRKTIRAQRSGQPALSEVEGDLQFRGPFLEMFFYRVDMGLRPT